MLRSNSVSVEPVEITLVGQGYPPDLAGGIERSVRAIAHGLVRAGVESVTIVGIDQRRDGHLITGTWEVGPSTGTEIRVWRISRFRSALLEQGDGVTVRQLDATASIEVNARFIEQDVAALWEARG